MTLVRSFRTQWWWRLVVAIVAVAAALFIRKAFPDSVGTRIVFVTFYPCVAIATLVGGAIAGAVATVLSALVISLWQAPPFDTASWLGLATFLVGSVLIVAITEAMHLARARATRAEEKAKFTEELKKSEEQFRTLVEQASDGIFVSDAQGHYLDVNSAACRMLGYSREEILHLHITELIAPDEVGRLAPHVAKLQKGETDVGEWSFRRKNGSLFVGEVSAKQLPDGRLQAFVRDVSERKRAEERQRELMEGLKRSEGEAREQHLLFSSIFEGVPEAVTITDLQRRIIMVNRAMTQIFGYQPGELIGSYTSKLFADPEEWEREAANLDDLVQGTVRRRIIRFRRKNGETFPGEVVRARYGDNKGGEPLGYLGIVRDVTNEQKREEEMRQAQRLEALGQLTGGIAHDFNNLLAVITGNLQLIEMGLKDEQLKRYITEAERAVDMGARLNQRLMMFGRQRVLAPAATNLNDQMTHMFELLHRTIGEHITVKTVLSKDLWLTLVDHSEIDNAILNLAINARDAMPNGGNLVIETENVMIDKAGTRDGLPLGNYVRLAVSDTGSGMAPEVLARAFEPFFTTKEPGRGTGLGLSSIYGFVKQSGGHITLHSEVGRGTTANIYLPKFDQSERTMAPREQQADTPIKGAGETILVVEDNPEVRRVTIEQLKGLGYRVLEAETGHSAITALNENATIDLVFSDVIMPGGMSGFELARKIKKLRPSQKILLASGFAGEGPRATGEDSAHGILLLRKPYSLIDLSRFIRAALRTGPGDIRQG
jgi:PAS domain S-box-containing protein